MNKADSQVVASMLKREGHEVTSDLEGADAVVVNTCAVRAETERKIARRLEEFEEWRKHRSNRRVVVIGCLARARPAFIASISPSASILGPNAIHLILEALHKKIVDVGPDKRSVFELPAYEGSSRRLVIPVAVGCLGSCSYCIMPISRGRLSSCQPEKIMRLFVNAIFRGAKEVYLVAQDLASYGLDIGTSLPALLRALLEHEGDYMIRLGMMEPSTLSLIARELLDLYSDPRVYKYLHLPLQSGSDRILHLMNRKYTSTSFIELVNLFRSKVDLFLATDVIVGFPTESEEDFKLTCEVLEKIAPDKVHVARYALRPFTKAASMPQLSDHVKKERSRALNELVKELTLKRNSRYVGKEVEVLLTDKAPKEGLLGRMPDYRPVVVKCDHDMLWRRVTVIIEEAKPHVLLGRVT